MSESQKIIRTLKAIEDIAFPHDGTGTRTKSIDGITDYQNDMRAAKPHIANIRYAITYKEYIDENDVLAIEKIARDSHEKTK